MAHLITIGEYANSSEQWAAEFLEERLPEEWVIYTNLTLPFDGQQPEIDLMVVGKHEVILVEVKGYSGAVRFSQAGVVAKQGAKEEVLLDYDPVAKIVQHAKKLNGLWKAHPLTKQSYSPWFRGLVFVTGNNGNDLTLDAGSIAAYGPDKIASSLTTPATTNPHAITDLQREMLDELLRLDVLPPETASTVQDFRIGSKSSWDGGFQRWEATSNAVPNTIFDLRIADFTKEKALGSSLKTSLEREAALLTSLSHISGVQRAWKLFEEKGPVVVLPLIRPKGKPLVEHTNLGVEERVKIAEQLVEILTAAHEQQFIHGGLSRELLWWDEQLSLLTTCGWGRMAAPDPLADAAFLLQWVRDIGQEATSPTAQAMRQWAVEEAKANVDLDPILELRDRLASAAPAEPPEQEKNASSEKLFEFKPGQKVGTELELVEFLGTGATGSVWRARHNVGQFDCALKFMEIDEENERRTSKVFADEFTELRSLYHPNLVRIYDAKEIQGHHYLMLEFCEETLRDWIDSGEPLKAEQIAPRMRDSLAALEYLHLRGKQHGDLCPESIGLNTDRAYLLDLGFLPRTGPINPRYRPPYPGKSAAFNDLYALALCFWEALAGYPFPGQIPETVGKDWATCRKPNNLNNTTWQKMKAILRGEEPISEDGKRIPYLEWFGFQNPRLRGDNPIPEGLRRKYDITEKYEQYLVAALLENDGRLSKRNLLVQAVCRRNLPASRRNLALHANYLSALRTKKILDYPKGKKKFVRITLCEAFHKEALQIFAG